MTKNRPHYIELKGPVGQEFISGETSHGLSKRHAISRQMIRIWSAKYETDARAEEAQAAHSVGPDQGHVTVLEALITREEWAVKHAMERPTSCRPPFHVPIFPGFRSHCGWNCP